MDYTLSNGFATDAGTGQRMHLQAQAIPTAVTDVDVNGVIWEMMEVIKAGGQAGAQFDKTVPATYQKLLAALRNPGVAPGRLVNIQVFSASGTYTPFSTSLSKIIVEAVGGGGAGGGAVATSSQSSAGGGGGGGCYAKVLITPVPASIAVTIGAGGSGVVGGTGGAGGTTSFGSYLSVGGGNGGIPSAASTSYPINGVPSAGSGTYANSASSLIQVGYGSPGQWGFCFTLGGNALGGAGGASCFGSGANWTGSGVTGNASGSRGGGGSGACNSNTGGALAGGSGALGLVVVYEYQ